MGRRLRFHIALPVAAMGGLLLDFAFPDKAIWVFALPGLALILLSLRGRRVADSLATGAVAGASFYLSQIQWASLFLGPLPMAALAGLQSILFAMSAVAISLAYRWIPRSRWWILAPTIGGIWTLRETVAGNWPYGGFAWGRLGVTQIDGPLSDLLSWVGTAGVGFLLVALVVATLETILSSRVRLVPVLVAAALVAIPAWPAPITGTMTIAAVQGNGPAGYFDKRNEGDLLRAQITATAPLVAEPAVDLVVWPEGSTDRDPLNDPATATALAGVVDELSAPLVAWGVTDRDGKTFNTAILWEQQVGPVDLYDKRHPVPFGEYVPDRAFWRPFAPQLIDLIQRDYTPGSTDPIFDVNGIPVGITICFDIVDDALLSQAAQLGAQVLVASSNNADFGRTDESQQQLAIARSRALELGRSVVNVSTVGITAAIAPDGRIVERLPSFAAGAMIAEVPLATTLTPAAIAGIPLGWAISLFGPLSLLAFAPARTSRRSVSNQHTRK